MVRSTVVAIMPPCIVPIGFSIHSFRGNRSSSVCSSALQETNSGSSMSLTRTGRSCPPSAGPQATRKIRSIYCCADSSFCLTSGLVSICSNVV